MGSIYLYQRGNSWIMKFKVDATWVRKSAGNIAVVGWGTHLDY